MPPLSALTSSPRQSAIIAVFGAYFLSQQANQYTLVPTTLTALYTETGELYQQYQILITQPASVPAEVMGASSGPSSPTFPLISPNDTVLLAAINAALTIITALNATIDTITVDDAIAAAERRQTANQTFGSALASGANLSGFVPADAAVFLASLKAHSATLLLQMQEIAAVANTNTGE